VSGMVIALCGGVGGAKLAHGLSCVLPSDELTVIVNTGDDFRHLGLAISPDLDSVIYALSGLSDPVRGWGRKEETWAFHQALGALGGETWFQLGDTDLAMHVLRTAALAQGQSLSEFTTGVCAALGIRHRVLPMSDVAVCTQLLTDEGWLDFQEYFVHRQCRPRLQELRFSGAEQASPQPEALAALRGPDVRAIIICPSNPFVSIGPILALPALRAALKQSRAPVIAVTPIIGGQAIKGPAAKMLAELGQPVSPAAVARYYEGLIRIFISDASDPEIAGPPGVTMLRAQTLMRTLSDRADLARAILSIADAVA
jgi:LPPG:FO 2-phospho-L-lactate transferase